MKKKPISSILYNFFMALSSATVGALIFSWPLLALFVKLQKTDQIVKQPLSVIMHNYNQLMFYLLWPLKNKLQMSNFPTSVNAAEHFYECKLMFQLALIVFIVGIIIYFFLKARKKTSYLVLTPTIALIFMVIPVVILPFAVTNFDGFFMQFHHILFNNSNWLFDPATDPIINVLTEGFFAACFAVAGIIYELYFAKFILKH